MPLSPRSLFPVVSLLYLMGVAGCQVWPVHAAAGTVAEWEELNRELEDRRATLEALVREAEGRDLCTEYAEVSRQVISTFRLAARHDREHVDQVRRIFGSFGYAKQVDPAAADRLALDELRACLEVADHAAAELRRQLGGEVTLREPPDLTTGRMKLAGAYYLLEGQTVFPSSLVWMPGEEGFMEAFGRLGSAYYPTSHVLENGALNDQATARSVASLVDQGKLHAAPFVFFLGHSRSGWMERRHPEITHGARHFTPYDVDSPRVRSWVRTLCAGSLPALSAACADRPLVHLLANEPHFATRKGGWLSKNGLSDHTLHKYRNWLAAKYKTVDELNRVYGTSYNRFDQVRCFADDPGTYDAEEAYRARQVDPGLRGGPVWYDWCRFNMDRVNDWFSFLKQQVQAHDGGRKAPVTIKMLGSTLSSSTRDGGLDIEYLTGLQEMPGADLRVAPREAVFYGRHEEGLDPDTGWIARYAYDWVEQSMYLDFTKSLFPDRLFYDSEWHGFSAVSWRCFSMERDYVRSALWMAFCHGMGAIKPWVWGRRLDGALQGGADHVGELSTQPIALDAYGRALKELNAHAEQVASLVPDTRSFMIYYCEEAAIQDGDYPAGVKAVYEALKLLNLPVGFATPSNISRLDPGTQTLMVPPTPFISDASLEALHVFQGIEGRIVLVGESGSFLKDEMGAERTDEGITDPFESLPFHNVLQMTETFETALARVRPAPPVEVTVRDPVGEKARGVMVYQGRDADTGQVLLVLNNVSKDRRVVELELPGERSRTVTDLLTQRTSPPRLVMEPCAVRMVELGGR